jgi:hypothetical protein
MTLHLLSQPLGESYRRVEDGSGEDEKEFFAAIASNPVDLSRFILEEGRELLEHGVAGLVTVIVVDRLELVDVAHHDRHRLVQSDRVTPHLSQPVLE